MVEEEGCRDEGEDLTVSNGDSGPGFGVDAFQRSQDVIMPVGTLCEAYDRVSRVGEQGNWRL
jgi:hypothetical protein